MKDIRLYIDKLHADAEDCLTISQTAPSDVKQRVFTALAETYRELAGELERIPASVLDQLVRRATWLPPPAVRLLCSRDHGNLSQERTGLELPHRASRGHIKETGRQSEENGSSDSQESKHFTQ